MTRDERPQGYIDKSLFVDDGTLQTFDQLPVYDPSVYAHGVFHAAPELFEMPVNRLNMADGTVLLPILANRRLRIQNPTFFNRLPGAKREEIAAAAYMFDSVNNAIIALGTDGIQYVIDCRYYGIAEAQQEQTRDTFLFEQQTVTDHYLYSLMLVNRAHMTLPMQVFLHLKLILIKCTQLFHWEKGKKECKVQNSAMLIFT